MTSRLYSSILLSFHNIAALASLAGSGNSAVLSIQRTLGIRFAEHTLYAQEDGLNIIHRRPFLFKDIETNIARHVNVRMIHWGDESDMGCRVRIGRRKGERKFERETSIRLHTKSTENRNGTSTESGGPDIVASHSRRFESVFGKAETPTALDICR